MFKIYSASKIWHAPKWLRLRDNLGYNIVASWINIPCGTPDNKGSAKILTAEEKRDLWINVVRDIQKCDFMVVYSEKDDLHNGAMVEIGIAQGLEKPIFLAGSCMNFEAGPNSDAAFTKHPLVTRLRNVDSKFYGYDEASMLFMGMQVRPSRFKAA